MAITLEWHLTCPTEQASEIIDLINSYQPAEVLHRHDFKNLQKSSFRLAFEQTECLGHGPGKLFNARNFDGMISLIQNELQRRYGDPVEFHPVNGSYQLPSIKPETGL